jgi:hypothetical protein
MAENIDDEDEAYLVVAPSHMKTVVMPDTIWAKIGDDGKLEVLRWDIIEMYARDYDSGTHNRAQTHIMCKLLMLVRQQVRDEQTK